MDTRIRILALLDHKEYYGIDKSMADAENMLRNIPSSTLLNYISGFAVNIYLHENSDKSGEVQFMMANSLLGKCAQADRDKWVAVIQSHQGKGHQPVMFWNYSNLLFYGLIFKVFNTLPSRDLTSPEAKNVFDAYLVVNGVANQRLASLEQKLSEENPSETVQPVFMADFLYQRDYVSSTDFSNQVTRGAAFFNYLENDPDYSSVVKEFYASKNISGYKRMFKNLLVLFNELNLGKNEERRSQLANVQEYFIGKEVDLAYIDTLCLNSTISGYIQDESFTALRNKFLFKLSEFKFLILDVNFLLDQFYKAQIFSFNAFLREKGFKNNFLSDKGKDFTEAIYLVRLLDKCFPGYVRFFGGQCVNSNGDELCDGYLRNASDVCLVEFKDVLLNASIKNNSNQEQLLAELFKKFVANQKGKPKGITQLINALKDIEVNGIRFDNNAPKTGVVIYPVIIYTDSSFGADGMNRMLKEKFAADIASLEFKNISVKELTIINLNFFEIRENFFHRGLLNLFTMLNAYHEHVKRPEYQSTPFEVFARMYMNTYIPENLGSISSFQGVLREIVAAQ